MFSEEHPAFSVLLTKLFHIQRFIVSRDDKRGCTVKQAETI